jgi:hypothetical protein
MQKSRNTSACYTIKIRHMPEKSVIFFTSRHSSSVTAMVRSAAALPLPVLVSLLPAVWRPVIVLAILAVLRLSRQHRNCGYQQQCRRQHHNHLFHKSFLL